MGESFRGRHLCETWFIIRLIALCFTHLAAATVYAAEPDGATLLGLPNPFGRKSRDFKVDPYIDVAAKLHGMGRERAISVMEKAASDPKRGEVVIILCRILFAANPRQEFRRPLLGQPFCPGMTSLEDWPNEPIEVVDGIPFLIVQGYLLAGEPESAEQYLKYCRQNCRWNERAFKPVTAEGKKAALQKLFASTKWERPLDDNEKQFLEKQIEPPNEKDEQKQ